MRRGGGGGGGVTGEKDAKNNTVNEWDLLTLRGKHQPSESAVHPIPGHNHYMANIGQLLAENCFTQQPSYVSNMERAVDQVAWCSSECEETTVK